MEPHEQPARITRRLSYLAGYYMACRDTAEALLDMTDAASEAAGIHALLTCMRDEAMEDLMGLRLWL